MKNKYGDSKTQGGNTLMISIRQVGDTGLLDAEQEIRGGIYFDDILRKPASVQTFENGRSMVVLYKNVIDPFEFVRFIRTTVALGCGVTFGLTDDEDVI